MGINAVITSFYDGIRSHYAIEFVLGEQIGSFFLHLLQVFKLFIKKVVYLHHAKDKNNANLSLATDILHK